MCKLFWGLDSSMAVEQIHVLSTRAIVPALLEINKGIVTLVTNILIPPLLKNSWIVCKSLSEREGK